MSADSSDELRSRVEHDVDEPAQSLREAWESQADAWAAWARTPGHDHYFWRYNLPRFLDLVPEAGRLTLDVGCGEGRVGRALAARGHRVVGIDGSPTLARLAATHDESMVTATGDAAALPVRDSTVDLVVAFMSLQDVDDLDGSLREVGRVLRRGGVLCMAVLHPLATAGNFVDDEPSSVYAVSRPYPERYRFIERFERDGLTMVFHSVHHPLADYSRALHDAGLVIDSISEPVPDDELLRDFPRMVRQRRIPWFLHLRALRP